MEPDTQPDIQVEPTHDWRTHLERGDSASALRRYQQGADPFDDAILDALKALSDARHYVRAKSWTKAQRAVARVETPPESVAEKVDWAALTEELRGLETSSKRLDKRDPDAALERLEGVTSPLLRAEALTQRGTAYIFMDDLAQAKASFEQALAHDPKHYRALTNLGNVALEENDIDAAIKAYEAALRLDEDFANAHHNLGVAYRRKGQIDRSVRSIRRAQKAMRRQDAEEAKGTLSGTIANLNGRLGGRWLRYGLYGVGAALLLWWLRSQGLV